jgi:hypothetical protein
MSFVVIVAGRAFGPLQEPAAALAFKLACERGFDIHVMSLEPSYELESFFEEQETV